MTITRRQWLTWAIAGGVGAPALARAVPLTALGPLSGVAPADVDRAAIEQRVATVIAEYERQGFHRTATTVDQASGEWLADQVRRAGLSPRLESFGLDRVDIVSASVAVGERRLEAIPLFDGAFTPADGITGSLGPAGSDAAIALTETVVNAADTGPLGQVRRSGRHQAIVAVTRGRRPGLCPSNADRFREPFGPPVLQVSSEDAAWLTERAAVRATTTVTAQVTRTPATAVNVVTTIAGGDATLAPFVVMTPRSGWYWCASERGGGIACWLEIMRALKAERLARTVHFVASSGHELGHLGIDAFIEARPAIVSQAMGWLHLGANIGAAVEASTTLQASSDPLDAALTTALGTAGLTVDRRNPRGRVPNGEAEAVHRGGGRYVSVIGGNGLFHHTSDRGPGAIDPVAIARFSAAFTQLVRTMATDRTSER